MLLTSKSRSVRAVEMIRSLGQAVLDGSYVPGSIRGYNQWAYYSPVDGTIQPYSLYVPHSYDPEKKYSLIVALHGMTGNDYDAGLNLAVAEPEDFIILSPFGRGDMNYRSYGERDVLDSLACVLNSYSIDINRVYLMGWSMGGYGTWQIGINHADLFAAIAPFCGGTDISFLENLRNTPVLIVHGDSDYTVPVSLSRAAAKRLDELGYRYRYDELPGVGHDAWSGWIEGAGAGKIFTFFRNYSRNPRPDHVTLKTDYLDYGRQYWVSVNALTTTRAGTVDARIVSSGKMRSRP